MLQPFSFRNGILIPAAEAARMDKSLCWRLYTNETTAFSIAAAVGDVRYLLCDSPHATFIYLFEAANEYSALMGSIESFPLKNIPFSGWVYAYRQCKRIGGCFEYTETLGADYMVLLEKASLWDERLISAPAMQSLPWRTILLISLLSDIQRSYLTGYITAENPSMQSLKLFIEKMRDFTPFLNSADYNREAFAALTEKRSPCHAAADALLKKLPCAKTPDNFESGTLQWSFTAKTVHEYKAQLQKLLDDSVTVEELFNTIGGTQ